MILFENDYSTHGGIIDVNTSNKTFIRMSVLLDRMGVRNNKFFLHLSQKELAGVDPHNLNDPSVELRQRIAYEAKVNPWYYFREVIRVPVSGSDAVQFELSRANLALMWLYFNNIDTFLVMPRQLGKTVGVISIDSWCLYIGSVNSTYGLFAKDTDLVHENVSKLKDTKKALPSYLVRESRADTDNKEGLSYDILNNSYKTFVAQADSIAAAKQGRGETLVAQHWDEFAYYKNNRLSFPSATSASDAASTQARRSGLPAANTITTTAGYIDSPEGEYAYGVKSECMRFNELIYDLDSKDTLMDVVRSNSKNLMFYLEYSYKQLGKDDEWFRYVTRNKSPMEIETDYLCKWSFGTSVPVIGADIMERMMKGIKDPTHFTNHKSLIIKWYVPKDILDQSDFHDTAFIIAADASNNTGDDYTTLLILDPKTLAVVGTCRCNLSNLVFVGSCITNLLMEFPNSILMPERNQNGAVIIDIVIEFLLNKNISPFKRIFNLFIQDYIPGTTDLDRIDLRDGRNRKDFGFKTTSSSKSREFLYSTVLTTMLNHMAEYVHDSDLADELRGLTIRKGRVDHSTGGHDDLVIALLLSGYFVLFGKNLHMYGVNSDKFFKGTVVDGKIVDPVYKERQENMFKRASDLRGLITRTENGMIRSAYERELKYLESQLDHSVLDAEVNVADQVKNVTPVNNYEAALNNFTYDFKRLNMLL
mgnify:CR=1 FL=1|jgi:hypothetical protein